MKTVILDAGTLGGDVDLSVFEKFGPVEVYEKTAPDEVASRLDGADFAVLNKVKLNLATVGEKTTLRLVLIAATGYDNVDLEYMKERGVAVCNVAGYSTDSVAQLTVTTALSLVTNLYAFNSFVRDGSYSRSGAANRLTPVYHEIAGMTWGVVGYGNIGRRVADAARALGCRVIAVKRTPTDEVECVSVDELCRRADIITLHVPLNEETRGMISRERIAAMKKSAVVVNAARGAVADEEALCEAVAEGRLHGIGSDVFSTEPFGEDSPYYKVKDLPNVCLTPHMAWGSYEARVRCIDEMVKNAEAFLAGERRSRVV
ncbi:MAG: hydroxyacid dehydrogenase [Clostridia bacterium]|nr:hydroxyacid dehydrogenase [Clostridia bacterium]